MKQKFILNQPQSDIGIVGKTQVVIADKNGNIKYEQIKKNAIETSLLQRLAWAIYTGSINPINSFGTVADADGIIYFSVTDGSTAGTILDGASVVANIGTAYVVFSGSRTISHAGSILKFALGAQFDTVGLFSSNYASQAADIAVSSGDTISATWTVSCSTT